MLKFLRASSFSKLPLILLAFFIMVPSIATAGQPYFQLKWGGAAMNFQSASGLDNQGQDIQYRAGDSKSFSVIKMPGLKKFGSVVLKNSNFKADQQSYNLLNQIKMNTVKRGTAYIALLDEAGAPIEIWTLVNAFPTKFTTNSQGFIDTFEMQHEGMTTSNP